MLLIIFGSHIATALLLLFVPAPSWLLIAALDYTPHHGICHLARLAGSTLS